ncbi:MAG: NADH-quinone oxidoreductase subunit N [Chloroflexi bacterium]|nr:NADH-quinone oxidoreductase subunit N [Chloroflexota bacterium]
MDQLLLLGPEIILTVCALAVLTIDLFSAERGRAWSPALTLAGLALAALDAAALFGAPAQPVFGQMVVADAFTGFFRLTSLMLAALIVFAAKEYIEKRTQYVAEFYALLLFVTLSIILLAASVDLIMVFLSFEFLSITSYIMVGYLRDDKKSSEGSIKYFLYGSVSSAIMLYGMSLLYGASGVTNLSAMAQAFAKIPAPMQSLVVMGILLTIVGFGFKIALAPFHQWSPDAYEGAPTPVTAFISVGPKVAGFAVLARVMIVALPHFAADWSSLLWAIAALSMTLGNLVALRQRNIKRLLAYSSIAQTGYMLIGIVANVANGEGLRGILVYLIAYIFTNIGLFIAVIAYSEQVGSDDIEDYAGMIRRAPFMAVAMLIFFLSLAGIPPTAGFIGKFLVFGAALDAARGSANSTLIWLTVIGAVNSVISVGYYFNIVRYMFFLPPKDETNVTVSRSLNWSLAAATLMTLVVGLVPQPFITFAEASVKAIFGG